MQPDDDRAGAARPMVIGTRAVCNGVVMWTRAVCRSTRMMQLVCVGNDLKGRYANAEDVNDFLSCETGTVRGLGLSHTSWG